MSRLHKAPDVMGNAKVETVKIPTLLLLAAALYACNSEQLNESRKQTKDSTSLKVYQKYALNRIVLADFQNQGFSLINRFFLWSWDDFGKKYNQNRVTRTYYEGYYHYSFWKRLGDTALIYAEDSIPAVQLIKDTLFDANGDSSKDLVITFNSQNGKCPPTLTMLFLLDTAKRKFVQNFIIEHIPNAEFHSQDKTITSKIICDMQNEKCKFKWNPDFSIDTIACKVTRL